MDVDAILPGGPRSCSSTSTPTPTRPARANEKRWQDVEQLLDAGIDVISTLNIQHLESLNDVITRITGTVQRETVPDDIVRRADQIELVDMAPEAIRRRMAHGNIYPAERVDAALANYFRPGNLGALRELALLWVADRVEESLTGYLDAHGISEAWETRERVVVGITGVAGGDALIRRAARMAGRVGGELIGVHVAVDDGLVAAERRRARRATQARQRARWHRPRRRRPRHGRSDGRVRPPREGHPARARREPAQPLARARPRLVRRPGDPARARHRRARHRPNRRPTSPNRARRRRRIAVRRRTTIGWLLVVVGLPLLIALTVPFRDSIDLSTELLLALVVVLAIAAIGGRFVGIVAAVVASLLVNWFFVPPYHTLTIGRTENLISLVVFIVVAVAVGALVDLASQRSLDARRARLEAEALARSTTSLAIDPDPIQRLVEQIRSTFDLDRRPARRPRGSTGATIGASSRPTATPPAIPP